MILRRGVPNRTAFGAALRGRTQVVAAAGAAAGPPPDTSPPPRAAETRRGRDRGQERDHGERKAGTPEIRSLDVPGIIRRVEVLLVREPPARSRPVPLGDRRRLHLPAGLGMLLVQDVDDAAPAAGRVAVRPVFDLD